MTDAAEFRRIERYVLSDQGEVAVAAVRWHPVWLVRPTLIFAGTFLTIALVVAALPAQSDLAVLLSYVVFIAFGYLCWKVLDWRTERLVVTNRRVLLITGVLNRKVAVMPMRKVTDLTFETSLIGRLLRERGWATFIFESAGQDQALHRVPFVPTPVEFFRTLSSQILGGAAGAVPEPRRDPATRGSTRTQPVAASLDDDD